MSLIQDKNSTEWLKIKEYCELRIMELREENDSSLDGEDTAWLRGKIEFAKEILDLDKAEIKLGIQSNEYID